MRDDIWGGQFWVDLRDVRKSFNRCAVLHYGGGAMVGVPNLEFTIFRKSAMAFESRSLINGLPAGTPIIINNRVGPRRHFVVQLMIRDGHADLQMLVVRLPKNGGKWKSDRRFLSKVS